MKRKVPSLDKPYRKHRLLSEEESRLWLETMESTPPKTVKRHVERSETSHAKAILRSAQDDVPAARKGKEVPTPIAMDTPTQKKLRRGKLTPELTLDLHGHTKATAHEELLRFLTRSQARGVRLLRVITGKGRAGKPGILRVELPRWLNELPFRAIILSFGPAGPTDGGEGAWYVRLKRLEA